MRDHPGFEHKANIVGLYGDDCRYNNVGEKLVVICMNLILEEPDSRLVKEAVWTSARLGPLPLPNFRPPAVPSDPWLHPGPSLPCHPVEHERPLTH